MTFQSTVEVVVTHCFICEGHSGLYLLADLLIIWPYCNLFAFRHRQWNIINRYIDFVPIHHLNINIYICIMHFWKYTWFDIDNTCYGILRLIIRRLSTRVFCTIEAMASAKDQREGCRQRCHWWFIGVGFSRHKGVSENNDTPKWIFIMENPIKMDDLGIPLFLETPIKTWEKSIKQPSFLESAAMIIWEDHRKVLSHRRNGNLSDSLTGKGQPADKTRWKPVLTLVRRCSRRLLACFFVRLLWQFRDTFSDVGHVSVVKSPSLLFYWRSLFGNVWLLRPASQTENDVVLRDAASCARRSSGKK